jgi:hypothetical protein
MTDLNKLFIKYNYEPKTDVTFESERAPSNKNFNNESMTNIGVNSEKIIIN